MKNLFLEYPKCSTCKKAKTWLENNNIDFEDRDIVVNNPNKEELTLWYKKSGFELKKFFNTSGILYREMGLKDKLKDMSEEEMIELLSTNGMLIKRPLIVTEDSIILGFKEENYEKLKK